MPCWASQRAPAVMSPIEAHGYRARESVGHTLWEMDRWLDLYLRPAPAQSAAQPAAPRSN